ncbi:MAG: hypothetical protein ACRD0K_00775 [Egibacteraceae bacterium]
MRRGTPPTVDPAPNGSTPPQRDRERHELRTEFAFELPRGYVDRRGAVHRRGVMRLATARDELVPLADDRVRENPQYLTVVLLARVITQLGDLDEVHAGIVENFFASDLAFLQDLYRRINTEGHTRAAVTCPACNHEFAVDVAGGRLGERGEAGS